MNTTYLLMSVPFVLGALVVVIVAAARCGLLLRDLVVPLAAILGTTAVFDNLIIWSGIVAYDETRILGLRIGLAPVEDFLYAIVAVLLSASLWRILGRQGPR